MAKFDRHQIQQLLAEAIGDAELFVVGLTVSDAVLPKITVVLDGPSGLGIDEIATITRRLNRAMEATYGEDAAYSLEVTSPGADQPLTDPRQYPRHVGRSLQLKLQDGTEHTGPLVNVLPEGLEITPVVKVKTRKVTQPAVVIPYGDIKEAKVVISFK